VEWLGTAQGFESTVISKTNIPFHAIKVNAIRGKGLKSLLISPLILLRAIKQAAQIIFRLKPDVVIGMGGFVSGPGGIASWLLRKPLVIHEQNAIAGLTNKALSCVAKQTLEAFPNTFKHRKNVVTIGNPIRYELTQLPPPVHRFKNRSSRLRLLVLGGSLGAQFFNELLPLTLARLTPQDRPFVLHQTGEKQFEKTQQLYKNMNIEADVKPFIHNMASAYEWTDLVLCRAGALTLAELSAVGLGSILVPFPHAVDDHQTVNAQFMVKNRAAYCFQQADLSATQLATIIQDFMKQREKCLSMAEAAYQLRNTKVIEQFFNILCGI
jgi:UDP-N-acetylglucosamine--N-acetylmuramyl-(pentapeptide) pyrophosphoryl-undecaprenol N-acetylglucosamine transferase